jgi:hypothetical protein
MGAACPIQDGLIQCQIADLAAGASVNGAIVVTATTAGSAAIKAAISGSDRDSNPSNDQIEQTITVTQPVMVQTAQSASKQGGGGGGTLAWPLLLCLGGLLRLRRVNPRPA